MRRLNILHLCSDYCKQALYSHLCSNLAASGHSQVVYCAARSVTETIEANRLHSGLYPLFARPILGTVDRFMFHRKVTRVARDLLEVVDPKDFDVVHAHFLYSDGAVALRLKRSLGLPFIVSVRSTDLNVFMKYRPDLSGLLHDIIDEASKIVCLSNGYAQRLVGSVGGGRLSRVLRDKLEIVPNGLESKWLANPLCAEPARDRCKVICVQDGSRNKNVPGLIAAAAEVARFLPFTLTIVGSEPVAATRMRSRSDFEVRFVGRVSDWRVLADLYGQHHVFAMPSFTESFGLVYIEALSQGLPIVHSKDEGPSGLFPNSLAYEVNPRSVSDIAAGIGRAFGASRGLRADCREAVQPIVWPNIASRLSTLYVDAARR
jgi:glycosyltransferase involved in cell wall biosynthesis